MEHHALLIPPGKKFDVLAAIANRRGRTIVFARTQAAVDRLVEQLAAVGVRAGGLHGGKTQRVRTRTLDEFRAGRVGLLVATDVAARGIHVDGVTLVLHADPPRDAKDYLHRAGRTARAGESGMVVTLVLPRQRRSTFSMLEQAGVAPVQTMVSAAGAELPELTGARTPTGTPLPPPPQPPATRPRDRRPGADRNRPGPARHGADRHATDRHRPDRHATDRHRPDRPGAARLAAERHHPHARPRRRP
jgi:superfamily II DNA/RNA helicase